MAIDLSKLGSVLRARRTRLGLSQPEAAKQAGVSTRLWSETERGKRPNVSASSLLRMLREVGVTLEPVAGSPVHEHASPRRTLQDAAAHGIDVSMVRAALRQSPAERIASNDDALAFFAAVRVTGRAMSGTQSNARVGRQHRGGRTCR